MKTERHHVRLTSYLKKYWFFTIISPLFMAGEVVVDLFQPKLMSKIVNTVVAGGEMNDVMQTIIMTSIAAAMGALPLILAAGPGAGSRQTIGAVIFSGAIFATLLTRFVVPVFYNLLARFTRSPEWTARRIEAYEHGDHG